MKDSKPFSCVSHEVLHKNPYWEYHKDRYTLADGNSEADYFYVHSFGSTLVIPVMSDGTLVMVKQFRYLNQQMSLEFPGGGIAEGCTPEQNALKELEEETGFVGENPQLCGMFNPYKGVTNEQCFVFKTIVQKRLTVHQDFSEQCEVVFVQPDQILKFIADGLIWDGMTIAAWTLYLHHNKTV